MFIALLTVLRERSSTRPISSRVIDFFKPYTFDKKARPISSA
jgi:hypothetical protein